MPQEKIDGKAAQQAEPASEAWEVLERELAPAMSADDSEFIVVSAENVIARNKRR